MAKHRPRFLPKALIGMGAVTGLAVMMPTPARAETIELLCNYDTSDFHAYIDTDQQSVIYNTPDDKSYGPYRASISDTIIRWTERHGDWELQYRIDRVAGTLRLNGTLQVDSGRNFETSGKCRRATQKF